MAILSRSNASEDDDASIRKLLVQSDRLTGDSVYCSVNDLDWWRGSGDNPESGRHIRLWLDEQEQWAEQRRRRVRTARGTWIAISSDAGPQRAGVPH